MVSYNSERAMQVFTLGCMYTAPISMTVGLHGRHLTEMDSRSGEQCVCMAKLTLDQLLFK